MNDKIAIGQEEIKERIDQLKDEINSYQNISSTTISLFKSVTDRKPVERTLKEILEHYIKGNTLTSYTDQLIEVLKYEGSSAYKKLKNTRETVCFSGLFKGGHRKNHLQVYNPIIVLDIDGTGEKTNEFIQSLSTDKHVIAVWKSPSQQGIKVLVMQDGGVNDHESCFADICQYFEGKYPFEIDRTGKDVSRMCHLSHDPNAVIREEFEVFKRSRVITEPVDHQPPKIIQTQGKKQNSAPKSSANLDDNWWEDVVSFTENRTSFVEGRRNAFVFQLASNCNRRGLDKGEVTYKMIQEYAQSDDFTEEEIIKSIGSAYNNTGEHGSYEVQPSDEKPRNAIERYKLIEKELSKLFDVRFNAVTGRAEYSPKDQDRFEPITDRFVLTVERTLKHANVSASQHVINSILESNFSKLYDPFVEYEKGLPKWDGKDYVGELAKTIDTDDPDWDALFRVWLRGVIWCLNRKNLVNHSMLILVGGQGVGKTTWLNKLIPEELSQYKFVGTINPNNKDSLIHLSECFLINLDELENLNRKDIGVLKSVITLTSVRVRRAYGRHSEELPRRASFAGSINEEHFLTDTTGSRRFLPFKVNGINYQHKVNIDQVYAQVIHECKSGEPYYFTHEQTKKITERNEEFRRLSIEEDLILQFFDKPSESDHGKNMSITEIINHICSYSEYNSSSLHQNNVGRALKKLGYEQKRSSQRRYYVLRLLPVHGMNHT